MSRTINDMNRRRRLGAHVSLALAAALLATGATSALASPSRVPEAGNGDRTASQSGDVRKAPSKKGGVNRASGAVNPTGSLGDPILCPVDDLWVEENAGSGVVSEWLHYGQQLSVEPYDDTIWAGVWFTGRNGPDGWSELAPSGDGFPLPYSRKYSLIARIGNGAYEYVGSADRSFTNNKPGYLQRVRFRVNDNAPGNGNGAFRVFLRYPCH